MAKATPYESKATLIRGRDIGLYDHTLINKWEDENQESSHLINEYINRRKNNEWMSEDEVKKYKSAVDRYKGSSKSLVEHKKIFGGLGDEDEKGLDSYISDLSSDLESYTKFVSQFKTEDDYNSKLESYKNSVENQEKYAELANSEQASIGWNKYLEDVEKANSKPKKSAFQEAIVRGFTTSSDNPINIAFNNVVYDYRNDDSYRNPTDSWTEEQRKIFGSLYLDSPEEAYKYATDVNATINQDKENEAIKKIAESATSNGWAGAGHTVGSIATAPFGLADYLNDIAMVSAGRPITSDGAMSPFEYSQAVTESISSKLNEMGGTLDDDIPIIGGKGWGDVYGLGTSIGKSIASAYTLGGGGTLISYFGQGAAAGVDEALSRGATEGQAVLYGTALGVFEGVAEKIGIDNLFKLGSSTTVKGFIKNILKQAGAEGMEEGLTSILGNIADVFVMQDKSNFNTALQRYRDAGMSETDAKWKVFLDSIEGIAYDTIAGAVSGGVSGSLHTSVANIIANHDAKKTYGDGAGAVAEAKEIGSDAGVLAEQYQKKLDKGKSLSGGQINRLVEASETIIKGQDTSKITDAVEARLTKLGETGDVSAITSAIVKQVVGEKLTSSEKSAFENSRYGQRVANEVSPENIKSGKFSSEWAESIGTKRINAEAYNKKKYEEAKAKTVNTEAKKIVNNSKLTVSDDGRTINTKTEKNIKIKEIASIKDGEMILKTEDGDTVSAKDVSFSDSDALIYSAVLDMGINAASANAIIGNYDPSEGITASQYFLGVKEAYKYGRYRIPVKEMSMYGFSADLSKAQKSLAYRLGALDAKHITDAAQKAVEAKKTKDAGERSTNKGKLHFDGEISALTDVQSVSIKTLEKISEAMGVDIYVYESKVKDGKRVYTDRNGNEVSAPNGFYDTSDGSIHIDLNAGNNGEGVMLFTAAHELTHFVKQWSPKKFKVLADFLMEQYGKKDVSVDFLVKAQIAKAASNGRNISYDVAFEEVVADSMEKMLSDGKVMEKLALLKQTDKTLFDKIKSYIDNLVAKIKSVYEGLVPESREAQIVSEMKDSFEKLQALFTDALVEASENYSAADVKSQIGGEVDLDVTTAHDYTAVQSDHVSPNRTQEQKAMWDLRMNIIMGKASDLTEAEQKLLGKNAFLKDLYRRFYVDKNADEYGIHLAKDQAEQIFPYEYWDKSLTYAEADKNGERFKEYCASMGIIPRFSGMNSKGESVGYGDFTNDKGYWKLLIDRKMYDNTYDGDGNWTGYGKYPVQKRINCSNFQVKHLDPEWGSATYGDVMSKANDPKKTNKIVNKAIAQFENKSNIMMSDRAFSYDELVAKDDLQGVVIDKTQRPKMVNGIIDKNWVAKKVKENCEALTRKGGVVYYTSVPDIGRNVEIIAKGLTHGFSRPNDKLDGKSTQKAITNARVVLAIPQILNNSIEVNRSKRGNNVDVPYTHVLIGTVALENDDGTLEYYAVRSMVQERENQNPVLLEVDILGRLTSVNAKKIGSPNAWVTTKNGVARTYGKAYAYKIADFLNDVKGIFDNTFSEDVYQHLGTPRIDDDFSENLLFSDRVTDKETLDFLENQEHVTVYRAMQLIDGKLYPPMNAYTYDESGKKVLMPHSEIGAWEQSVERPDLIDPETGKFRLDKGKLDTGKRGTPVPAAYNPYIHTSLSMLNDQFTSAYQRSNLVVVKGVVPKSELTSGYKAQYAKDSVGETEWHSGVVSTQLPESRKVILSRWFKPVEVLDNDVVAKNIKKMLGDTGIEIPYNVVSPKLRRSLEKIGVPIGEGRGIKNLPDKNEVLYSGDDIIYQKKYAKGNVVGTNLGIKEGESSLQEAQDLFNKLNSNTEIGEFAKSVFATAEKLGVNIQFASKLPGEYPDRAGVCIGDTIWLNTSYFNSTNVTNQRKAKTILHEYIHACTVYAMKNNKIAAARLNRIYNEIKNDPAFAGKYGIKNAKEMVAELANEDFVRLLKKKNLKKNLWDRIVDWICDLFGFRRGTTAYDKARKCVDDILDNPDVSKYRSYAEKVNARRKGKDVFGRTVSEDGSVLYSDRTSYAPTFYSQMGKVVEGVKQEKLAANSVVNMLRGKGVKAEEIRWSGIVPFLEGKKSVTKKELLDFINGSMLQIGEQMSSNDIDLRYDSSNHEYTLYDKSGDVIDTFTYSEFMGGYVSDNTDGIYSNQYEIDEAVREEYDMSASSRWGEYSLEGGENYREIVFTIPNSTYSNQMMRVHWGDDAEGVLAHARIQDFYVKGKKMLFVEEIQSDWHNEGHKEGYEGNPKNNERFEARKRYAELGKEKEKLWQQLSLPSNLSLSAEEKQSLLNDVLDKDKLIEDERDSISKKFGKDIAFDKEEVPDAPFKDTYHEYVLKRLLRMAAEEGYDSIGWTPAEIQSKRWSDEYAEGYRIEYDQDIPKFLRKYGRQWGAKVGKTMLDQGGAASEDTINRQLEFLAEWNNALANARNESEEDFIRRQIEFTENEIRRLQASGETVWSMDITDSMKNSVLYEGQVMYQERDYVVTDNRAAFTEKHINDLYEDYSVSSTSDMMKDYAQAYVAYINPSDFLSITSLNGERIRNEAVELDLEKLRAKDDRELPYLEFDEETGEVYEHDGRHRLVAFENAGIEQVAIRLLPISQENKYRRKKVNITLEGQEFHWRNENGEIVSGKAKGKVTVTAYPLSPSCRPEIEELFGTGKMLYQERSTEGISPRSLLANALESAAAPGEEKNRLRDYKTNIRLIEAEQKKLSEIMDKLFAKGSNIDPDERKKLQFEMKQTSSRINSYDRQLLKLEAMQPIKKVLAREKEMVKKRQKQKDMQLLADYKEKSKATVRELLERNQESRKKAIEGRDKTLMRHKIKGIASELDTLLRKPTAKKHIKEELRADVADALLAINMDTVGADERVARYNEMIAKVKDPDIIAELTKSRDNIQLQGDNLKEKLSTLQKAYEKIKASDDVELSMSYQEVIRNSIANVSEKVGNTSIRNMSLEQLEMVYDLFSMIRTTIRNANKAFNEQKGQTIMQMAEAVNDQVRDVGGQRYKRNALVAALQREGWQLLKPFVAFRTIGSVTLTNLYKKLRAGEDTFYGDVKEAQSFIEEQYEKCDYKSWDLKKTKSFKAKSGKTFDLTLEQMMTLYAYSKREKAHKHIIEGGIVFEDAMLVEKNKLGVPIKYEVTTKDAFNLSEETFSEIANSLSAEQKAFVDAMQEYLSKTMGAKGNEVSMELLGVKLFKEEFYLPIKSSQYYRDFSAEEAGEVKLKSPAFSKETVPHANNPIVIHDFTDLWAEHINDMSMYHSFVLALEDFTRVYNYKTKTDDKVETMDTKATLETAYPGSTKYINKFLKDMNGGVRSETVGWAEKLTSLAKKGSVLGSLSVMIQQPSAVMRAMAIVNPKHFVATTAKSFNLLKHKQDWAELKKYAPIAGIKEMGRFDVGMGQGTVDWIKSNKTLMNKGEDFLSAGPALMDEMTWVSIWNAVKRETATTNKGIDPKSDEFLKIAGERFADVISLSQVYDSVFARSDIMRNKSWIAKATTAFMAEPMTTLNMAIDAFVRGKRTETVKGFIKSTAPTAGAIVAAYVLNSALKSIVTAAGDDDEDESYWEKYLEHFVGDLKDSLNPLTLMPFAKDIVSIFQGYDVERMDMALVSDLYKAIEAFDSDSKTMYEKWSGLIGATSAFFGIPVKNVERDVRAVINTFFGERESTTKQGLLDAISEGFTGETKSNGQQLYEAILSGDAEHIERISGRFKDQKAIDTAIRKALRENDPRIKEAAEAQVSGNMHKRVEIAKEIFSEGNFSVSIVNGAINSEIKAIKKEEKESKKSN